MNRFLHGFADELVKLGAFAQQAGGQQAYDAGVSQILEQSQGMSSRTGLRSGQPVQTSPVITRPSPTPLTTPSKMVDYLSRSEGR